MSTNDTYSAARKISDKDAALVMAEYEAITAERGRLDTDEMAKALVERARPKDSATHHLFEWDVHKAAAAHLVQTAKEIIRSVLVVFVEKPDAAPVRALSTVILEGKRGPVPTRRVLSSVDLRAAMLEQAKLDMMTFEKRYAALTELSDVFAAMRKATKRVVARTSRTNRAEARA